MQTILLIALVVTLFLFGKPLAVMFAAVFSSPAPEKPDPQRLEQQQALLAQFGPRTGSIDFNNRDQRYIADMIEARNQDIIQHHLKTLSPNGYNHYSGLAWAGFESESREEARQARNEHIYVAIKTCLQDIADIEGQSRWEFIAKHPGQSNAPLGIVFLQRSLEIRFRAHLDGLEGGK